MTINSAFATSILGMMSQTQALGTISQNIANATAGGYKRTETRFQTVLGETLQNQSDLGGVKPIESQMIDRQGIVLATARDLDLAITGDGFFIVSTELTGGETFYTRDGAFEMKLVGEIGRVALVDTDTTNDVMDADPDTGGPISAEGYLVDRNGYFLLGWAPDDQGVFPTSGTPEPMRVDADHFADIFEETSQVEVGLNLPATADLIGPTRQIGTVTLSGTLEAGDVYSITVAGTTFSYTLDGTETIIADVRDELITLINADTTLAVTAAVGGNGVVRLSADTPGTAFTSSATATNGGATADNSAVVATTTANVTAEAAHASAVEDADSTAPADGFHTYSISVFDSEGTRQPVRFNFTRSGENTWQFSATHSNTPVAQVDTVTLGGAVHAGDVYTVTVDDTTITYTATGAEADLNAIRDSLITQINAAADLAVTASAGTGTGVITLTADTAGTAFTTSASADDTTTADNTATFAGTIEAGDQYSITVNATVFSYTVTAADVTAGDTIDDMRNELITLINANLALPVTAAAGGAGEVVLTADVAGTAFTATAATVAVTGGTATEATVTANATDTVTTTAATMVFTGKGALESITDGVTEGSRILYNLDLTFDGGSTATFEFDVTDISQFDSGFVALSQNVNGFEASDLRSIAWDQEGFLVGTFNSDNSRRLYKLPLATFASPNNLTMKNGMVFAESEFSGEATIVDPNESDRASFVAGAIESSNVEIAEEFTRMIQTQAIYNANALAFRTNDEMTVTARDLARA